MRQSVKETTAFVAEHDPGWLYRLHYVWTTDTSSAIDPPSLVCAAARRPDRTWLVPPCQGSLFDAQSLTVGFIGMHSDYFESGEAGIDVSHRKQEIDRLHGTTVTLIHPLADASLNLSYDYHSDETAVISGNPTVRFDGTLASTDAYVPIIPTTLARTFDWSATSTLALTRRLRLFAGDYYTDRN